MYGFPARFLLFALLVAFFSTGVKPVRAEENSGTASDASPIGTQMGTVPGQKKFAEDEKITDTELRSRLGSRSQLSLKFDLEYDGPPVGNLSATDQPNPDQTVSQTATGLSGTVGARYRLSPDTALSLNAGMSYQYLFHGDRQRLDVEDPLFFYERSFRVGGIQMIGLFGGTYITSDVFKARGQVGGFDERLYCSYHFSHSAFSISTTTKLQYYFFNRDYDDRPKASGGDGKVRELSLTFAPYLKYNVTDRLNVNTSVHFNFFHPRSDLSIDHIFSRLVYERVGFGYGITKDIYLDPYVQFFPTQFSWRETTMNVTAVFSLL